MSILRAVVRACPLALLTLVSCEGGNRNYPGEPCSSIGLGKKPAGPELTTPMTFTDRLGLPSPYIAFNDEVGCCIQSPQYPKSRSCAVDCEALYTRLTVAVPTGDFPKQPCGTPTQLLGPRPSEAGCRVYLEGEEIVAVNTFCPH